MNLQCYQVLDVVFWMLDRGFLRPFEPQTFDSHQQLSNCVFASCFRPSEVLVFTVNTFLWIKMSYRLSGKLAFDLCAQGFSAPSVPIEIHAKHLECPQRICVFFAVTGRCVFAPYSCKPLLPLGRHLHTGKKIITSLFCIVHVYYYYYWWWWWWWFIWMTWTMHPWMLLSCISRVWSYICRRYVPRSTQPRARLCTRQLHNSPYGR